MNKPVHLGVLILELSKIFLYEYWHEYVKSRYGEKVKLCYMNTESFIVYIKAEILQKILKLDLILQIKN